MVLQNPIETKSHFESPNSRCLMQFLFSQARLGLPTPKLLNEDASTHTLNTRLSLIGFCRSCTGVRVIKQNALVSSLQGSLEQ